MCLKNVPIEFKHMVRQLKFEIFDEIDWGPADQLEALNRFISYALIGSGRREAAIVAPFLRELLQENQSSDVLGKFWATMPTDITFSNGEFVRILLSALLRRLESELTGHGQT